MKPSIVIVDDSLTVRMDLAEALASAGFDTAPCADLGSARRALAAGPRDLVILDIRLPDGDGIDFLNQLRSRPDTEGIPVLLLSSEAEVGSRVRGIGAGADEYVGKPYEIGQVVARARALIGRRAAQATGPARRILVIDDSATFRHELSQALEDAGFAVETAASGEDGLALAAAVHPDAVVVDGMLPGIDGATVVRRLKSDSAFRSTPCLLLTATEDSADELRALEAGADAYVRKSDDLGVILVRLTALLRGTRAVEAHASLHGPKRLLAVDDSTTYLQELGAELRKEGYDVVLATSGEEALQLLAAQTVDCILLDVVMPGLSGQETCRRIKQAPEWRDIPLVMLTARDGRESMIEGINAGADDYITKSSDFEVLKARLRAQLRRKQFEDENRRFREQLVRRETEARFQRLIHSNIIGIILGDVGGQLTDANDAFLQMLGYSRAEMEAGLLHQNRITPPEWRERDLAAVEQLKTTGSATPFEKEFVRKDGSRLPSVLGLVLLEGADKTVGFVLDRSEQKRAEDKLQQVAKALEEANSELESFSYSVAHDLRAPLRRIDGFSHALEEDYQQTLDDQGRSYLRFIREGAQHMAALIEDLLMLSRVTRAQLLREDVDLGALARESVARLRRSEPEREVTVVIPDRLLAHGDPRLLTIVFDNLLGNAWKFTSKRGLARIELGVTSGREPAAFFLSDNGAGFDMSQSSRLFGVFQRLHSSAEFEGTGIGLATVQRIVRRHGGRIWAEGAPGKGATFYFTLGDSQEETVSMTGRR